MKGALLVVAAFVVAIVALGRVPAAASGVDSVDLVIQQAFAADAEGFCAAPIPWCYGECVNCAATSECDAAACVDDCAMIAPRPLCCGVPFDICDCL